MLLLLDRLERRLGLGVLGHRIRIEGHLVRGSLSRHGIASGITSVRVHCVRKNHISAPGYLAVKEGEPGASVYTQYNCFPSRCLLDPREDTEGGKRLRLRTPHGQEIDKGL